MTSHMLRHAMGVVFVVGTWIALSSIYSAVVDFDHYWLQGLIGLALGGAALLIYRRWFVGEWQLVAIAIAAPATIAVTDYIGGGK
jgi:hypothetical protein